MPCETIKLSGGGVAIVKLAARPQRRCSCGAHATLLCDYPMRSGTCDKPLCTRCAVPIAEDVDYCPHHPREQQLALAV
jgi:hypothetical protein